MNRLGPAMAILAILGSLPAAAIAQPDPITDFFGTEWTETSITLSWTSTGGQSYDIRYSMIDPYAADAIDPSIPSVSDWYGLVATQAAGEPEPSAPGSLDKLKISGLSAGMFYVIAITSTDAAGQSEISVTYEWTLTPPPEQVLTLEASKISQEYVTLTWVKPDPQPTTCRFAYSTAGEITDANFETVYAQHQSGRTIVDIADPRGTQVTFKLTGLQMSTPYWIAMRSSDQMGAMSPVSNNVPADTPGADLTPPDPVTDLDLFEAYTDAHSAYLSCTVPQDLGGGDVWYIELKMSTAGPIDTIEKFAAATRASWKDHWSGVGEAGTIVVLSAGGLDPKKNYWFSARARDNSDLWSGISNWDQFRPMTPDTVPPAAITLGLKSINHVDVTLKWIATGDDGGNGQAARYVIKYTFEDPADDPSWWNRGIEWSHPPQPSSAGTPEICKVSMRVVLGEKCWFAITAFDTYENESPVSNAVPVTFIMDASPPSTIVTLTSTKTLSTSVMLAWQAPFDGSTADGRVGQYQICYSTNDPGSFQSPLGWWQQATEAPNQLPPGLPGTIDTVIVTGLNPDTSYYFMIRSFDPFGNGSVFSNPATGRTRGADLAPPAAITNLSPALIQSTYVILTWTAPGDDGHSGTAVVYEMRWSADDPGSVPTEGWWAGAAPIQSSTPIRANLPAPSIAETRESVRIDGLTPDTTYHFAIRAMDDDDKWSPISTPLTAETDPRDIVSPAAITTLRAVDITWSAVTLAWKAEGEDGAGSERAVEGYEIRYSTRDPGSFESTNSWWSHATPYAGEAVTPAMPGNLQTVTLRDLEPDQAYFFAVRSIDEASNSSDFSNVVSVVTLPAGSQGEGKICSASSPRPASALWGLVTALSLVILRKARD